MIESFHYIGSTTGNVHAATLGTARPLPYRHRWKCQPVGKKGMSLRELSCPPKCTVGIGRLEVQFQEAGSILARLSVGRPMGNLNCKNRAEIEATSPVCRSSVYRGRCPEFVGKLP